MQNAKAYCGDTVIDTGEQCDQANLNGSSCNTMGYSFGNLICNADCTYNISSCTSTCGNNTVWNYNVPPTVQIITTPGAGNWTVPAGVTSIKVEAWGGGGGGGSGGWPYGGGGGAYARINSLTVTPGSSIPYTVGTGGVDGWSRGGDTTFNTNIVVAAGGGTSINPDNGLGGTVAGSIGDVRYAGGNGAAGAEYGGGGGGGGGSGGSASNGNNAASNIGAAAVIDGGPGGNGGNGAQGSSPISGPGGGGGAGSSGFFGSSGYAGQLKISYVLPVREAGEICDGTDLDGQTCVSQGFDGGPPLTCNISCTLNTSACYRCGDGNINGSEVCDGVNFGTQTCVSQGFTGGTLACNATCTGFITTGCLTCGNNTVWNYNVPPTVQIITTPGAGNWTVPAGVTSIKVEAWGGGGAGGGGYGNPWANYGGGGGGGAYARVNSLSVTPGSSIPYVVGRYGYIIQGFQAGVASTFNTNSVVAAGGSEGKGSSVGYAGGIGGTVAASTGDVKYAGGGGTNGSTGSGYGSGGGSSGGSASKGNNGSGTSGGTAVTDGGPGGNGGSADGNTPVSGPGGGGSGGGSYTCNDCETTGGNGYNGQLKISYVLPVRETGEICDGTDLDGQTCVSQGFDGGPPLTCNASCAFNTSLCNKYNDDNDDDDDKDKDKDKDKDNDKDGNFNRYDGPIGKRLRVYAGLFEKIKIFLIQPQPLIPGMNLGEEKLNQEFIPPPPPISKIIKSANRPQLKLIMNILQLQFNRSILAIIALASL